ncbi:hypothetical protein KS4_27400 [Poriferisphaera corsica]|uniref:DUF4126 domain-containing protein n=1 Tax=Poriferisphaera corsica TaxID=2528020 RepID=A0A517YWU1_9BACT|nr:DUF4126 domain-containing protein [Poriferisphaera corsica]QDU34669.1 hypothetical protein KS4_27400 [Poriferisphaera corsica]
MDLAHMALGCIVGLGLAAACGFRIFVPLLILSIAGNTGHITIAQNMDWIASPAAIAAFSVATGLEIAGYYVPWIDNMLDTAATPAAIIAGSLATASFAVDVHPMIQWSVAIIGGGSVAGITQAATVVTRALSSVTTAGFGNPVVATVETTSSLAITLLLVILPITIGAALVGLLLFLIVRFFLKRRAAKRMITNASPIAA